MQRQLSSGSSKKRHPRSARNTSTELSVTKQDAPASENGKKSRVKLSTKPTVPSPSSTWNISPDRLFSVPDWVISTKFKDVCDFFHLENLSSASTEEAIFLHVLYAQLANQAKMLAAILPWSVQRPLRALLSAMSEHGRNYTKQSKGK